jgi:hypothetical protein
MGQDCFLVSRYERRDSTAVRLKDVLRIQPIGKNSNEILVN